MNRPFKVALCLAVIIFTAGFVYNQEAGKGKKLAEKKTEKPAEKKTEKPATHKVVAKPFKIELNLTGVLAGVDSAEIAFKPLPTLRPADGQNTLALRKIVEHGVKVTKGDVLAQLDTTKLDEVIDNLEAEQKALQASLKLTEEEIPLAEVAAPVDLAVAEHAKKRAEQELKYFLEVAKSQIVRETNMSVTSAKFALEYAEEELAQLKKMYKANDLTEETEKMILRRQKHYVERIAFYNEMAIIDRDYIFKYALPEKEKSLRDAKERSELAWDKIRKTGSLSLAQKKAALIKMQHEYEKNAVRLDKFRKDRNAMTLKAPIDGVVYHGRFHQGQWSASESLANRLTPGGTVSPDDVFLTIVQPQPLVVHLNVEEKEVHLLKPDAEGVVKITSQPDRKVTGRIAKLSAAPTLPGKYPALVKLNAGKDDGLLVPGMACSIKFVPYAKKSAIVIPTKYVHDEDGKDVVFVLTSAGKEEMRAVTKGRTHGDDMEIVSGLRDDDEVLIERPSTTKGATP